MIVNYSLLTPTVAGLELVSVDCDRSSPSVGVTARSGTGFDEESPYHMSGTDAVRYAIAIQQLRDAGRYADADAARAMAVHWDFEVFQTKDATRVVPKFFKVANGMMQDAWSFLALKAAGGQNAV
jgi:hypothetical protein